MVRRARADPCGSGDIRAVHAYPRIRLLDARTRHPGRARNSRRRGRCARGTGGREIVGSLAYVVGKLGKAPPDGSRITFELTGPLARTLHLEVHGRAALVPELSGPATSTITLDSGLFARLAGGRVHAFDHLDEITLGGDTTTGRRIVENLAFTI